MNPMSDSEKAALIERALLTRVAHLEAALAGSETATEMYQKAVLEAESHLIHIARILWSDFDPTNQDHLELRATSAGIIEELKRLGLKNGGLKE